LIKSGENTSSVNSIDNDTISSVSLSKVSGKLIRLIRCPPHQERGNLIGGELTRKVRQIRTN